MYSFGSPAGDSGKLTVLYNRDLASASHASVSAETAAAVSSAVAGTRPSYLLALWTLWLREVRGFYRQRARVIAGLATPLIFWFVLGSGFGASITSSGSDNYLEFFFPGAVTLTVLFASIFSNISVIEDRREGFLLSVLVAPIPRYIMVLGKILGATTIGAMQGAMLLPLIPILGIRFDWLALLAMASLVMLMAFGLTGVGFYFAWKLNSTQGFHSVMNILLMPMWLLSGALFPLDGASLWMRALMTVNPLMYGVVGFRRILFGDQVVVGPSLLTCWTVSLLFAGVALALAVSVSSRPSAKSLS